MAGKLRPAMRSLRAGLRFFRISLLVGMVFAAVPAFGLPLTGALGLGVANPAAADPVGYLGSVSLCAQFDDSFGAYASLWRMGMPGVSQTLEGGYDSATAFSAGVEYRLSVAEMEPFLRAGGGFVGAKGSPSVSAPMVEFGLGARWLVADGWLLGFELGRFAPMDELGGIGGGALLQLQLAYRFEL